MNWKMKIIYYIGKILGKKFRLFYYLKTKQNYLWGLTNWMKDTRKIK